MFFCFFFSSRRRHTRLQGDWSSDVCSSDLCYSAILGLAQKPRSGLAGLATISHAANADRKSVVWGKSVDLGGRRIIIKKGKDKSGELGGGGGAGGRGGVHVLQCVLV